MSVCYACTKALCACLLCCMMVIRNLYRNRRVSVASGLYPHVCLNKFMLWRTTIHVIHTSVLGAPMQYGHDMPSGSCRLQLNVKDCNSMSSDCNPMSSGCNPVSSDCNPVSSDCNPMSSDCNPMSSDCNPMMSDCNPMSSNYIRVL